MNNQQPKASRLSSGLAFQSLKDTAPTGDQAGQSQTPAPAAPAPAPKKPERVQVTYYHDEDTLARAKQAYEYTRMHTGYKSWTAFVEAAVNQLAHQLEEQHNDRKPFGS